MSGFMSFSYVKQKNSPREKKDSTAKATPHKQVTTKNINIGVNNIIEYTRNTPAIYFRGIMCSFAHLFKLSQVTSMCKN